MTAFRKTSVLVIVAALAGLAGLWIATAGAAYKNYPVPRPKPPVPLAAKKAYPMPRPNPRRDYGTERTTAIAPSRPPRRKLRRRQGLGTLETPSTEPILEAEKVWSADEIADARRACMQILDGLSLDYEVVDPIGGPDRCGVVAPIKVSAVGATQSVAISPPAVMNCKMAAAVIDWMDTRVQISALAELGEKVVSIQNVSSYVCRPVNNAKGERLSEHALGNALDVASFTLESGETVSVLNDWAVVDEGDIIGEIKAIVSQTETPKSRFLEQVHAGGCQVFSTILGPNANKYHADHFHFDLGRGGRYLVCE